MAEEIRQPDDSTFRSTIRMLGDLLIARKDVKAVEFSDGTGWRPDESPFTIGDFRAHIAGKRTLGTYMVGSDSRVKFFALDIDLLKDGKEGPYYLLDEDDSDPTTTTRVDGVLQIDEPQIGPIESALHDPDAPAYRWVRVVLRAQIDAFQGIVREQFGLESLAVLTGGGAHVLVPLPEPTHAKRIRSDVIDVMRQTGFTEFRGKNFFVSEGSDPNTATTTIEIFPKQDDMEGKNFGNLIRLPLGIHRRTGVRTVFVKPSLDGRPAWDLPTWKAQSALAHVYESLGREVPK